MSSTYRSCLKDLLPYVPGRPMDAVKKMYGLSSVVKLASNENPYGCSPTVHEAVIDTLNDVRLYPDGACSALREALADKFQMKPNRFVFGAGSDEVIAMIGKAFIEPGDECITASVTFPQYETSVLSMGGKMVYVPGKDFGFDLSAVPALITDRTKLIFIANPNNPSGTYHTAEEQDRLMAAVPSRVTVVFDEAYQEYVTADDYPDTWETLRKYDNAILLKTFSKIYGLASFRVGYGVMSEDTATQMEKFRSPFNVGISAQAAALAAIKDAEFTEKSRADNRRMMAWTESELTALGIKFIPSQANFIATDFKRPSKEFFEKLMSLGYIIRSGVALGMTDGWERITIGTEDEMKGLIMTIKTCINFNK